MNEREIINLLRDALRVYYAQQSGQPDTLIGELEAEAASGLRAIQGLVDDMARQRRIWLANDMAAQLANPATEIGGAFSRERFVDHPARKPVAGGLSVFSIASRLRSVKRLFNWLTQEEILAENPAKRLKLPKLPQKEPKALSSAAFAQLLAATEGDSTVQRRDRALLLVLADTGCRVGGLAHLRVQDIDLDAQTALVTEKGEKIRPVYFMPITADALRRWLEVRPQVAVDWLFVNLGPVQTYPQLTEEAVGEVLRRLRKVANVTEPVTPHRFRHAFAREYLRNGGDLATLSRLLGHSSVEVTARYYAVFTPSELQDFHARFSPVAGLQKRENHGRTN